jgi:hypothetical protein
VLATATAAGTVDGVVTIVAGTEDEAETIARGTGTVDEAETIAAGTEDEAETIAAGTEDEAETIARSRVDAAGTEDEAETIARSTADAAGTEAIVAEAMAIETGGMATEATAEAGVDMMTMLARVIGATWRGRSCLLERSGRGSTGRREKTVLAARRGHTLPSTSRPRKKCCPRFR